MAKIGDSVPRIIDKAVDFMASSQAFMEYLKKSIDAKRVGIFDFALLAKNGL